MLAPLAKTRWTFETAAHLLNRAGFGGTPAEIERLHALGLDGAVEWLVEYERQPAGAPKPSWAQPDPQRAQRAQELRALARELKDAPEERRRALEEKRREYQREERRQQQEHILDLRQWWLQRMASGSRPLEEKLTLFWHGHFATSVQKVRDPYLMWQQNETLRRLAGGRWQDLLAAVAKDPAMLIWLDQAQSRREHPNENFARELMELFALGEGRYTEKDVTEAARAFTGWSMDRVTLTFQNRPFQHDAGLKTVLGRSGALDGEDIIDLVAKQPVSAEFVVTKLWGYFASAPPSAETIAALARQFEAAGGEIRPVLRGLFRSKVFYAPEVVRQQVKSPVQWLVGSVRMLEHPLPEPRVCAVLLRSLGQELFAPPNVKGWDGGLSWITTNNLLNRYNGAALLVDGRNPFRSEAHDERGGGRRPGRPPGGGRREGALSGAVDVGRWFTAAQRENPAAVLAAIERRLLQGTWRAPQRATLLQYLEAQGRLDDDDLRQALRLAMSTPDYQLT